MLIPKGSNGFDSETGYVHWVPS